jgi:hypothetical protein
VVVVDGDKKQRQGMCAQRRQGPAVIIDGLGGLQASNVASCLTGEAGLTRPTPKHCCCWPSPGHLERTPKPAPRVREARLATPRCKLAVQRPRLL